MEDFALLKSLRKGLTHVSFSISHSTSPLEVATALEKEDCLFFEGEFKIICTFLNYSSK